MLAWIVTWKITWTCCSGCSVDWPLSAVPGVGIREQRALFVKVTEGQLPTTSDLSVTSDCTVKRRPTPGVRMRFSVKAGRGGQRSFRRRPDHAP